MDNRPGAVSVETREWSSDCSVLSRHWRGVEEHSVLQFLEGRGEKGQLVGRDVVVNKVFLFLR